jgi:hypothetical protein
MASNLAQGDRGYRITGTLSNMDAYDRLPRELRQALQDSDQNWSAKQCYVELRRPKAKRRAQFATLDTAVSFIRQQDNAKHAADAAAGLVCLQREGATSAAGEG